jgi:hypothetical protein
VGVVSFKPIPLPRLAQDDVAAGIHTRIIGPWTIPPSADWSDRGGRFRAIVHIQNGEIIAARLEEWGILKYVCFGRGSHERGWLPSKRRWATTLPASVTNTLVEGLMDRANA